MAGQPCSPPSPLPTAAPQREYVRTTCHFPQLHVGYPQDTGIQDTGIQTPGTFRRRAQAGGAGCNLSILSGWLQAALDFVVEEDLKAHLTCWYIQKYVKENPLPQYLEHLQP